MKTQEKSCQDEIQASKMPKWFPIDDEMKELSAMLEKEYRTGPVSPRDPCLDTRVCIETAVIFAALPRSRAMKSPKVTHVQICVHALCHLGLCQKRFQD